MLPPLAGSPFGVESPIRVLTRPVHWLPHTFATSAADNLSEVPILQKPPATVFSNNSTVLQEQHPLTIHVATPRNPRIESAVRAATLASSRSTLYTVPRFPD